MEKPEDMSDSQTMAQEPSRGSRSPFDLVWWVRVPKVFCRYCRFEQRPVPFPEEVPQEIRYFLIEENHAPGCQRHPHEGERTRV